MESARKRDEIRLIRERRRHEKEEDLRKRNEIERMKHLSTKAVEHYRLSLMKWRVWIPLRKSVQRSQLAFQVAADHYRCTQMRYFFLHKNYRLETIEFVK